MIKTGFLGKLLRKQARKSHHFNCFSFIEESRLLVSLWTESLWEYLLENYKKFLAESIPPTATAIS